MKILIVDDEKKIADVLTERLKLRGLDATAVYTGESALALLKKEAFDGLLLDLRLPGIDGIDVLRHTMKRFPEARVVILSGHGTDEDFRTCLKLGAVACFHKPAKISHLVEKLTNRTDKSND
jgi:DNA-binding response OmpR family regulator